MTKLNTPGTPSPEAVCHHLDLPTAERTHNLANWLRGPVRVMIATTSLGAGIDHPTITLVIHCSDPYSLINYVQESGRAGRHGGPATSLVYTGREHATDIRAHLADTHPLCQQALQQLLSNITHPTSLCRRLTISSYMDDVRSCSSFHPSNALCEVCLREDEQLESYTPTPATIPRPSTPERIRLWLATSTHLATLEKEHGLHIKPFLRWAREFSGKCPFCLTAGFTHDHQLTKCPQSNGTMFSNYLQFRSTIRLPPSCFYCAFPLDLCDPEKFPPGRVSSYTPYPLYYRKLTHFIAPMLGQGSRSPLLLCRMAQSAAAASYYGGNGHTGLSTINRTLH